MQKNEERFLRTVYNDKKRTKQQPQVAKKFKEKLLDEHMIILV